MVTRDIFQFDKLNYDTILAMNYQLLYNFNWDDIDNDLTPIDDQVQHLTNAINEVLRNNVPTKTVKQRSGDPLWLNMNPVLRQLMKKKDKNCKQ